MFIGASATEKQNIGDALSELGGDKHISCSVTDIATRDPFDVFNVTRKSFNFHNLVFFCQQ